MPHDPYKALYVHLPFCVRRCRYCDFATEAAPSDSPAIERYVEDLCLQVRRASKEGELGAVETVYLGGGTPSHVGLSRLSMLLYTLSFPRLCASVRSIGLKTGNLYTEANLNPEHYPPFLQADETVLVLAAVICVGYILFCCIKLWNSPPKAEKPGDDTPM